jgi:hypothetical protein
MGMRIFIRDMMTGNFKFSLTGDFFLGFARLLMEVNDEVAIVIVIILDVVLANRLIGVLGDFQIGQRLRFINVVYVFGRIVRILFVNVIGFCFKTQLLLHPGKIPQELLR